MIYNNKNLLLAYKNKLIKKSYHNNKEVFGLNYHFIGKNLDINLSYENNNFYLNLDRITETMQEALDLNYNIILIPRWKKSRESIITIPQAFGEERMGLDITNNIKENNLKIKYNKLKLFAFHADKNQKNSNQYRGGRFSITKYSADYTYTYFDFIIIGTPRPVYERATEYDRILIYGSEELQDVNNLQFKFNFLLKTNYTNINEINFLTENKIIKCN